MASFDIVLRGGTVIDGTGGPAQLADVGVRGDRIVAIGDLAAVDPAGIELVLDCAGRVVAPGFIDPHGHSDGSVLVDGALASHLHQGFTTQLSGNCGDSLAPVTEVGRALVELSLRPDGLEAGWATFGEYLDRVEEQALGPNVAFLVGHGTVRGAVLGELSRAPRPGELAAMVAEVETAIRDARAGGRGRDAGGRRGASRRPVPAERLRLRDRGLVREGAAADLVVFDPETVADEATYLAPARYPTGIEHVLVNGRPAIRVGVETGERPGRLLRRT